MARIRRLTALAGVAALASTLVTGPAQAADTPEIFQGSAAGTALDLAVLGKQVTLGASSASADSTGKAAAKGIGVLTSTNPTVDTALGLKSTEQEATAADGATVDRAKTCGKVVTLPSGPVDLSGVLSVGLACSAATADSATRSASAEGSVVEAGVNAATLIQKVEEITNKEISNEVQKLGTTLAGLLTEVCKATKDRNTVVCDAQTTLTDLVESVLHSKTLDVEIGKTTSSVTTTGDAVTSTATAAGATVKILPLPQVNGLASTEPVVTIKVGASKAEAVYNRGEGASTGKADPAIVRITFNTVLTKSLADQVEGLNLPLPVIERLDDIVIDPNDLLDAQQLLENELGGGVPKVIESCEDGRAICILKGSPLESKIYLATSKVTTNPDGSVVANADAVRMDLVTGIPFDQINGANATVAGLGLNNPGVRLAVAGTQAGVGGRASVTVPPVRTELDRSGGPLPPLELPRTGGLPMVPMLGAGALGLAGLLRRAARKATR